MSRRFVGAWIGFNEAPAERGGKHRRRIGGGVVRPASMRPPLNAGENRWQANATTTCAALQ